MFSLPKDKDEALRLASVATEALAMLSGLASGATPSTAASAITIMRLILDHLQQCFAGKVTADAVRTELKRLQHSLDANDQTADRALTDKHPSKKKKDS